jgi:hypothetical protein
MKEDYIVVERTKLSDLVNAVNFLIQEGYKPIGGISKHQVYLQAMIKN